ncbi:MAG: type II toxin-antitoxin system Phd/YefM family antitoxin [Coriobacteriales bacterium]|nr:type II toxin-antitoxin system Phd/YefM family antitoxin [Coriobacteriales bacterium]
MRIRPISKCQSNFNEVAELCRSEREPIWITKHGYEDLVLLQAEDYERRLARLELYDRLAAAQRQLDEGCDLIEHDELFSELRSRLTSERH